jgi:nitric oxide synthase-interacting protein
MRQFDACGLCLNRAREPLACSEGHLFCKECVYTDLCEPFTFECDSMLKSVVSQKKDIKRQKEKLEVMKRDAEMEKAKAKQAARDRVLLEFEKGQLGLAALPSSATTSGADSIECELYTLTPLSTRLNFV